ncbi:hypothetical protein CgunFtcFv8_007480 [Champsocephalus gunnari]|uniref:Uncharacterized protein n=1 Tax=Champsocephalus gunnari TaxID=52237 RepID=A0AAN8H5R3_CHAGU|nr:hypothetical protein CgunFtcFv8_007480 [Champsocephalus gunnari]
MYISRRAGGARILHRHRTILAITLSAPTGSFSVTWYSQSSTMTRLQLAFYGSNSAVHGRNHSTQVLTDICLNFHYVS